MKVVNTAKRHPIYRALLQSVVPCDVWPDIEQGVHIVIFPMERSHEEERHLAFAIDPDSWKVASTGILVLSVSTEGWTVHALDALDSTRSGLPKTKDPRQQAP